MKSSLFRLLVIVMLTGYLPAQTVLNQIDFDELGSKQPKVIQLTTLQNGDLLLLYNNGVTLTAQSSDDMGVSWEEEIKVSGYAFLPKPGANSFAAVNTGNDIILVAWRRALGIAYGTLKTSVSNSFLDPLKYLMNTSADNIDFSLANGDIYLTCGNEDGYVFYHKSSDKGDNFSDAVFLDSLSSLTPSLSILGLDENYLMAVYTYADENKRGIYYRLSGDNGLTWSEKVELTDNSDPDVQLFKAGMINDQINILFEVAANSSLGTDTQSDLYRFQYLANSETWTKQRVTTFIGDDNLFDLTSRDGKLLTLIKSNREEFNFPDYYITDINTFVDPSPPLIYYLDFLMDDTESPIVINSYIEDYTENSGTQDLVVHLTSSKGDSLLLFDDGLHSDSLAGDFIYGNVVQPFNFNQPSDEKVIDVNNIYLPINNQGLLAQSYVGFVNLSYTVTAIDDDDYSSSLSRNISFQNPDNRGNTGLYDNHEFLFSAGFGLSGYLIGQWPWATGVMGDELVEDYISGAIGAENFVQDNLIYQVKSEDPPFGPSWQDWEKAVKYGAYFYDGDNDGNYNPVDKNNNGLWDADEDKPDLLYDATYFSVYNDGRPSSERRWDTNSPLGIEIRQTIFASKQNSVLDDVIFVRYSIVSTIDSLKRTYFTVHQDPDIGNAVDDLSACDTTLNAGIAYNDGPDDVYGESPVALFVPIVQGPPVKSGNPNDFATVKFGPTKETVELQGYKNLGMTSHTIGISGNPDFISANTTQEFLNVARGFTTPGELVNPCEFAYGEILGGIDCSTINPTKLFSGDPIAKTGWINNVTGDKRNFFSTGPFTLPHDEPVDIIVAYVVGKGSNALSSFERAREITEYVHEEYQRNFSTIVSVEDEPEEVVNRFSLSQNYPNPFNPTTTIEFTIPNVGTTHELSLHTTTITVYNILGQKVATLLNEVKAPGSYEVTFDASQLASGVYFYRLSSGSFIQTKKMVVLK